MKTFTHSKKIMAIAILLLAVLLIPNVWISGTTIVTLSRSGTLTVKPMGHGIIATLRAIGIDIKGEGVGEMLGKYCVECYDDDDCRDDPPPPWHKFRFLITRLAIKEGVTHIESEAFTGLSKLKSVAIADGVNNIPSTAFANCGRLSSIAIPGSVTRIGALAFRETGLKSVRIPGSVTTIWVGAFINCTSLTSVTIDNGVSLIGDLAFYGCASLSSITIPKSVIDIRRAALDRCNSLVSIDVDNDNPEYSSVNGVLFNKAKDLLIQYPSGKQGVYTIPNSVRKIRKKAFFGSTGLTAITIPDSVIWIMDDAFLECTSLTSVTCLNPAPPEVGIDGEDAAFNSLSLNACLYVLENSINAYRHASAWKKFKCIKPIPATGDS